MKREDSVKEAEALERTLEALVKRKGERPTDVVGMRAFMDKQGERAPVASGVEVIKGEMGGVGVEEHVPAGGGEGLVLYFHGGGYVTGSPTSHRTLTTMLAAKSGARVVSVDYGLAPDRVFPCVVDDGMKVWGALRESGAEVGKTAFAGDSAGGGAAAALALRLKREGKARASCLVLLSPWADLTGEAGSMETRADLDPSVSKEGLLWYAGQYLGGADARNEEASPVFGDWSDAPRVLAQVGGLEVLYDDAATLCEKVNGAGGDATLEEWEGMFHVWHWFHFMLPQGLRALERAAGFMKETWGV